MSFFRNRSSFARKQEEIIKEVILNTLTENVREIEAIRREQATECVELCEATTALCTTLEAFFLHGLKDSLLWQTLNVIAGDEQHRPQPSFWSPLLVFLHKEVIQQIQALRQITSEIGYCRSWVRLTLNDSLFSSYLNNMRKQRSAFTPYYKNHALIMDKTCLEMAARLLQGLEVEVEFKLPYNSSLLNQWTDLALQLSALWTPALKIVPVNELPTDVAEAVVVAEEPTYPTPQPVPTNVPFRDSIVSSPFKRFNERLPSGGNKEFLEQMQEVLKITSLKEEEGDVIDSLDEEKQEGEEQREEAKEKSPHLKLKIPEPPQVPDFDNMSLNSTGDPLMSASGNSLAHFLQTSWQSADDDHNDNPATTPTTAEPEANYARLDRQTSYNVLLRQCVSDRPPLFTPENEATCQLVGSAEDKDVTEDDFEIVPESSVDPEMMRQLSKIPHESGLSAQGFVCKLCMGPLLGGYGNFKICGFTGNYYCDNCMHPDTAFIPARIIFNWDFRKYLLSKQSSEFLKEIADQPLLDLEKLNPEIYNAADAMAELQSLRIRLNFIRAYLYTCTPSSAELLEKYFFGRKYVYEEIHTYSVNDLSLILRGTLTQQLHKVYKMGEAHILKCVRCSQKGFICEVCHSSRVLYPFHIDTTFRCVECGAVFHPTCLNENQPCPKCERLRKRVSSQNTEGDN